MRVQGTASQSRHNLGGGAVFDEAIEEFAVAYADQNVADYETFKAAVDSGRLTAQSGL